MITMDSIDSIGSSLTLWPRSFRWRVYLGLLSLNSDNWESEIIQQRNKYQEFLQRCSYPTENAAEDEDHITTTTHDNNVDGPLQTSVSGAFLSSDLGDGSSSTFDLDPLTMMLMEEQKKTDRLQELELKYRREKVRRKRGLQADSDRIVEDETYDEQAVTLQIIDKDLNRLADPDEAHGTAVCSMYRKELLRQVLFVFACLHSDPGYRQGMHEIASYILYALELEGIGASPQSSGADLFGIFEEVIVQLLPIYDQSTPTDPKPLDNVSRRVLELTARYDTDLCNKINSLNVPPQLMFTKWIRLLFSREVYDVLTLWDALIETTHHKHHSLQITAEALTVSRLLLHRDAILHHTIPSDCLHWLMNMPMEASVEALVRLLNPILLGEANLPLPKPISRIPALISSPKTTIPVANSVGASDRVPAELLSTPPLTGTPANSIRFSFSNVKDKIASKTQTISKRLYQELENLALQTATTNNQTSDSIASHRIHADSSSSGRHKQSSGDQHRDFSSSVVRQRVQHMDEQLAILQSFAISVERQHNAVPSQVWESLADLQLLCHDLKSLYDTNRKS